MKLRAQRGNGGHITSYNVTIGSREAREAGFVNDDLSGKEVKKTVDAVNHRIILELADEEQTEQTEKPNV